MPEKFILDSFYRKRVLLGKRLTLEETAEVLDILRGVKGLTFDFHKNFSEKKKRNELIARVQEVYKNFIPENYGIPKNSVEYVGTFGSETLASTDSYLLEVIFSFGDLSTKDLVRTGFRSGYARIINKTPAIVAFN